MFHVTDEISSARPWRTKTSLFLYVDGAFSAYWDICLLNDYQWLEVQAQHAFVRDEQSKGRWDAALTRSLFGFMMEVFERTVGRDLGPKVALNAEPEHVC